MQLSLESHGPVHAELKKKLKSNKYIFGPMGVQTSTLFSGH